LTLGLLRPGRLVAYGHSWVAGDGATRPELRLVDVAAARTGLTPVNLGVGGSSSSQTAELVRREGAPAAEAYLLMAGLNDARLDDPTALGAYAVSLDVVVGVCAMTSPGSVILLVRQPPLHDYSRHVPHDRGSPAAVEAYHRALLGVSECHPQAAVVEVTGWDAMSMLADDTVPPHDRGHAAVGSAVAHAYRSASIGNTSPVHD